MTYIRSIGEVIGFVLLSIFAILDAIIRSCIPKRYKMKSINGEIALVTGGGGGLGRLLSLRLANLGAIVIVWDINETGEFKIETLKKKINHKISYIICNKMQNKILYALF